MLKLNKLERAQWPDLWHMEIFREFYFTFLFVANLLDGIKALKEMSHTFLKLSNAIRVIGQ